MTELLLGLITGYGPALLFVSCFLSCLLVPIPSSLMMLTGGAFVASGDLLLWQVAGAAYLGALLGDQAGFQIGRRNGQAVLQRLRQAPARAKIIGKAEAALTRHGGLAVFFSTWLVAALGPWTNIVAGAARLSPIRFTLWDAAGEAVWVALYVGAGYLFADQIEAAAEIAANASGMIAAAAVTLLLGLVLRALLQQETAETKPDD